MDVAAADAARPHPDEHLIVSHRGGRDLDDGKDAGLAEQEGLQKPRPFAFSRIRMTK